MKKYQKILQLKPTQFAVGMLEVDEKLKEAREFSPKELKQYVKDNPVPVVRSPEGELYIVDKHHFLNVCYHVGVKKVKVELRKDFKGRKMTYTQFWKWMVSSRNMYPFCQFGEGPRHALYLPDDIRGLADDPYRSLAWFVRKSGAFENSDRNFAEFKWANFFRKKNLLIKHGKKGLPQAMVEAVRLAQSPAAKKLPGFEKLNFQKEATAVITAHKKGKKIAKKLELQKPE
jgi:hypothetical protein